MDDPAAPPAHSRARPDLLARAREAMERRGITPTPFRLEVVDHLVRESAPVSPYALGDRMTLARGRATHVNSIYRVLEELIGAGIVMKIVAGPSYLMTPDAGQPWGVMLCSACSRAEIFPLEHVATHLDALAAVCRFSPSRAHVEILGTCSSCLQRQASKD